MNRLIIATLVTATCAVSPTFGATPRMDRSKLHVGAYCYRSEGYDEQHVREVADCGVDFIIGVDAHRRDVLDLFSKYGLGVLAGNVLSGWWGGDGKNAGKMRAERPRANYEKQMAKYVKELDHPAIWMIDLCDEPSAKDMPYLGEISALVAKCAPATPAYLNLYPNYAVASKNTGAEEITQLGTRTYKEHIEAYCRTSPLDYISYDFYVYTPNVERRKRLYVQMYDNFNIVADACRRTGRSFWYIPQVNSHNAKNYQPTTVARLRFQAFTALAYGAESINWACWFPGWWTNNVYTADGKKTAQYDRLKKVNAEIHRFGPDYMRYRSVATHFVGFPHNTGLDTLGMPMLDELDAGVFQDVALREKTALLVGEMAPRGRDDGSRAMFVVASGDPFDEAPAKRTVAFRALEGYTVRVLGVDGEILPAVDAAGVYSFELVENAGALVIATPLATRMDRTKLQIGTYCLAHYARSEAHVRDVKECGVDFIYGIPATDRATLDLCAKYGLGVIATGAVPFWHGMGGQQAGQMKTLRPLAAYEKDIAAYADHPAIWMLDYIDEPSALDFPWIGEVTRLMQRKLPKGAVPYINLYPNYASVVGNTAQQTCNQLGTKTYDEHVAAYVKDVPVDYACFDFYMYSARGEKARRAKLEQFHANFKSLADACRATGKSLWYIPQVNSSYGELWLSENMLRFQAYLAMAYGTEQIDWACWSREASGETADMPGLTGWWTNNVLTLNGEKTEQYGKLKKINAELHLLGPAYMKYRNVATRRVGDFTIGDMVARDGSGRTAQFVLASADPFDEHPTVQRYPLAKPVMRVTGGAGRVPVERGSDGSLSVAIPTNAGVLIEQ